jgi:exodeoxyribonuclease VII large subunit
MAEIMPRERSPRRDPPEVNLNLDFAGGQTARPERRGLTVSQLTARIQGRLESEFADVWVEGEISNCTIPASGHWYFSLKDDNAQIRAVLWKTAARLVKFRPCDGMKVLVRGAVRVYAPKGEYQISADVIEPLGKGSLQQAFEDLKFKLEKEGLFDPSRKRPVPMLPRRIGIVTSPTGAVIQDILRILSSRFANVEVLLFPARVQGEAAASEIVQGLKALGRVSGLEVIILARGGGSLEDLWAFNEEIVARAIAASPVPTISAVGHETDFTIADFVADLRAPTPSAAAERVVKAKADLVDRIDALERRLHAAVQVRMTRVRARVSSLTSHRVFAAEQGRVRQHAQRVDDLVHRSERGLHGVVDRRRERLRRTRERLEAFHWERQIARHREGLRKDLQRLEAGMRKGIAVRRAALGTNAGKLDSLSPLAVLSRGYALVWDERRGGLVRRAADLAAGDPLRVRVHDGELHAVVVTKEPS